MNIAPEYKYHLYWRHGGFPDRPVSCSKRDADRQFDISAVIPHHSIAIPTRVQAQMKDMRVHELADATLQSQHREIRQMSWSLSDIAENGIALTTADAETRPVPEFGNEP